MEAVEEVEEAEAAEAVEAVVVEVEVEVDHPLVFLTFGPLSQDL